jgi:two-component system, cell cycle response regulator
VATLEHTIYGIRRGWRTSRTFLFAGAFAAAVVGGVFSGAADQPRRLAAALILLGLWALVFGLRARRRFGSPPECETAAGKGELELGLLLVAAVHAGVQMLGGLSSTFYPVVFVLVAFLVVYTRQWVGFTLVAATIGIETAMVAIDPSEGAVVRSLIHALFVIAFAVINLVFTRTELSRMRRRAAAQIARAENDIAADARDFRLTTPASGQSAASSRAEEEARLSRCTVGEVRRAMYQHIDLLKSTMRLHTCLLLWLDGGGKELRILECVTDADNITPRRLDPRAGAPGAVLQRRLPVVLDRLKPGFSGLAYYDGGSTATDFLGVPVLESGSLRGVLCADRLGDRKFEKRDVETLEAAVDGILQIIANERLFSQLQRAKSEQSKLLGASSSLSRALNEEDVVDAALDAAAQIASFDVAAVALEESGKLSVRKAAGEGAEALVGARPTAGSSLAACALKNRHFLPYRGQLDPKQQVVFSRKTQRVFARMRSALVLPLISGDRPVGVLALATVEPSAYGEAIRTTMQVMTNQLGIALQNARMVRRLEELATTDGLTGLPNHRVFQEELDRQLAAANRFGNQVSIVLGDVDKFKSVNDTYGHPVGDVVLRGLADVLRRNVVRDTDLPARYGGEEFAVVCGGTGIEGALKLAERIRADLEAQVFHTEEGELRVTMSMGVATFPEMARDKQTLIERSDAALYVAKQSGRNQVRVWSKEAKDVSAA